MKSRKKYLKLAVVLLLIGLVVSGFAYLRKHTYTLPVAPPPEVLATPTSTENWKTYTNDVGFSIEYPPNLMALEASMYDHPIAANPQSVTTYISGPANPSAESSYLIFYSSNTGPNYNPKELTRSSEVTLDNRLVRKMNLSTIQDDIFYINITDSYFITIYVSKNDSRSELAHQIMSTFKFLK